MQSPQAKADATKVIILSPTLARPQPVPSPGPVNQLRQAQLLDQSGWKNQISIVDQTMVVKGDFDAVEVVT